MSTDLLTKTSAPKETAFPASLSGKIWRLKETTERQVETIRQKQAVPGAVAHLLAARQISPEEAGPYLQPTLRHFLPDPLHLKDMDTAIARTITAITQQQSIAVFGDYDVDGATSASMLIRYFRALQITLQPYIPDRLKEGYGPNPAAMETLRQNGTDLVITVDCGAVAYTALEAAQACGLDVIVLDHHLGGEALPPAVAVVNPNRVDETSPHRHLAAAGVTYLFLIGLTKALRETGYFDTVPEPNLLALLDLVALGTVCDVMPLTGLNRALVAQGVKVMAKRGNLGIAALMETTNLQEPPSAYHLGFLLGPRVNAGGRVGASDLGTRLLSTEDPGEARQIAQQLDQLNRERQAIEQAVLDE
ncbi:MAG: DHH family phosphoesterase, partial [Rickettsiales bacterium]|nr:DHH family phosphoesterase [Rickettsiales bacterium]